MPYFPVLMAQEIYAGMPPQALTAHPPGRSGGPRRRERNAVQFLDIRWPQIRIAVQRPTNFWRETGGSVMTPCDVTYDVVTVDTRATSCDIDVERTSDSCFCVKVYWNNPSAEVTQVMVDNGVESKSTWCDLSAHQAVWQMQWPTAAMVQYASYATAANIHATTQHAVTQYANGLYDQMSGQSGQWLQAYYGLAAMGGSGGMGAAQYVYGEAARAEESREYKEAQAQRKAAHKRAEQLLLSTLTPEQREAYLAHGYFEINTDSGSKYRIKNTGLGGNVKQIGADGVEEASYCIHVNDYDIPIPDNMMAQKLLLETEEKEFLRVANKTVLRIPDYPIRYAADLRAIDRAIAELERL